MGEGMLEVGGVGNQAWDGFSSSHQNLMMPEWTKKSNNCKRDRERERTFFINIKGRHRMSFYINARYLGSTGFITRCSLCGFDNCGLGFWLGGLCSGFSL